MTQTATISSLDKKKFLKKAFKVFCGPTKKGRKRQKPHPFRYLTKTEINPTRHTPCSARVFNRFPASELNSGV